MWVKKKNKAEKVCEEEHLRKKCMKWFTYADCGVRQLLLWEYPENETA